MSRFWLGSIATLVNESTLFLFVFSILGDFPVFPGDLSEIGEYSIFASVFTRGGGGGGVDGVWGVEGVAISLLDPVDDTGDIGTNTGFFGGGGGGGSEVTGGAAVFFLGGGGGGGWESNDRRGGGGGGGRASGGRWCFSRRCFFTFFTFFAGMYSSDTAEDGPLAREFLFTIPVRIIFSISA